MTNQAIEQAKNAIAKRKDLTPEQAKYKTVADHLGTWKSMIAQALPKHLTPERMSRLVLTQVRMNPKLMECSIPSLFGAVMQCCQLGLEPGPLGLAYMIPRYNGKTRSLDCQFQIGYKGLLNLFYRHSLAQTAYAHSVHERDTFEYSLGLEPKLIHVPASGDRGGATHFYAVAKLTNGAYGFAVMTYDEIQDHRQRFSKASESGPWVSDFEAMAKKTVLLKALKYMPLSIDIMEAVSQDNTVKPVDPVSIDSPVNMADIIDVTAEEVTPEPVEKPTRRRTTPVQQPILDAPSSAYDEPPPDMDEPNN